MAKIEDVSDRELREALSAIDAQIGEGNYTVAARRSVDTYLRIVEKRPDFIPAPPNPNLAPQFTNTLPANRSRGGVGGGRGAGWPNQGGIRVTFDETGTPSVSYEKERFSMSEASTYFEFVMEEALRAGKEPPAGTQA